MAGEFIIKIIAEIGQNYNGDLELAKDLIFAASENGADIAKFQVFNAEETYGIAGNDWFDYNLKNQLNKDDIFKLFELCEDANIEFMASAFHSRFINWLEEVGVKRYKLASREIHNKDLIDAYLKTNKPILISLGYWNHDEFPKFANEHLISYLFCVSKYPTLLSDINFSKIDFNKYDGFSDHTVGISASMIALSRGAKIIEKHFTLDKKLYGPDHSGSMTPDELNLICSFRDDLKKCW